MFGSKVNQASFDGETAEVTINGQTRRVKAWKNYSGNLVVGGLTARYATGKKAWPATIEVVTDPRNGKPWDNLRFGRDDGLGRCKKTSAVFFA